MTVSDEVNLGCLAPDEPEVAAADAEAALVVAVEAFISSDARGNVVAWNPAAQQTFGWSSEDVCGKSMQELIIAPRCRLAYQEALAALTAQAGKRVAGQRLQLNGLHKDGREFPMEVALSATRHARGHRLHLFARDITARKRAERFAGAQAAVSRALATAASTEQAETAVVDAVAHTLRWPIVELWLTDHSSDELSCPARHVSPGRDPEVFVLDELDAGIGVAQAALSAGIPIWVPDLTADARYLWPAVGSPTGLRVAVAVPFGVDAAALTGVMVCYGSRAEDPEDTLVALLGGIAAQLGEYLQRRRAEELEVHLARSKDEVLALVTHELRNPLSIIVSCVNLLEDECGELTVDQQRRHLQTVHRNTDRLTMLIDDLLDLSVLESDQYALHLQHTDLCRIIDDAVADIRPRAEGKRLHLTVDHPRHATMDGDVHRLRQVADNLLSNAVKYTPAGGTVSIALNADDDNVDWSITDTGVGIPAADRPRIFQRFYRASTALSKDTPGTGLGLAITRAIVERHHGNITLTDNPGPGPGTTFTIRLPTHQPAAP